jgi:hypothetical protein
LALPLRRCAGLSVLGLEVFRSLTSGRWSEDPLPAPSLSSGATTEFDHSRQSIDPSVHHLRQPTLSGLRPASDRPLPASNRDHHRRAADGHPDHEGRASTQHPTEPRRGRPPKRLHRPRSGGQRYDTHPKARTGPPRADIPDRSRETSLPSPLGSGRQAIHDQMREPAASSLPQTTRGYMTGRRLCFQRASDPTLRRKSCRRVTTSPSDVTPMEEGSTISLYPDDHPTTVSGRLTRGKPRGHQ